MIMEAIKNIATVLGLCGVALLIAGIIITEAYPDWTFFLMIPQ